jgi:hypothetical protein
MVLSMAYKSLNTNYSYSTSQEIIKFSALTIDNLTK